MRALMSTSGGANEPRAPGHVLVLAAEFPPVGGGGVIRVTKLVKYLTRLGWTVEVVCSDEPLGDAVDTSLLDELPSEVTIHRVRTAAHAVTDASRVAKTRLSRESLAFRALFRARATVRALVAIPDRWLPWALAVQRSRSLRETSATVILGSGPPHSVHIASAMLSRATGLPFVMDLRDEWTIRTLTRSRVPWRIGIERVLEQWCLPRAAAIVVVSEESRARYAARYPRAASRMVVIPNGFDPEDFEGLPAPAGARDDTLTLGYAGSFQVGTDIEPMFAAIGAVTRRRLGDRRVRFEMIGPFTPGDQAVARRHVPPDALEIRPFAAHRAALARMREWTALCVVATDGRSSLAGKLYECLATRKPVVVVAPEGPATRLVGELCAGTVADPQDADAIEEAIVAALEMASRGFEGVSPDALRPYDRRHQAERWSRLLTRVSAGPPR